MISKHIDAFVSSLRKFKTLSW